MSELFHAVMKPPPLRDIADPAIRELCAKVLMARIPLERLIKDQDNYKMLCWWLNGWTTMIDWLDPGTALDIQILGFIFADYQGLQQRCPAPDASLQQLLRDIYFHYDQILQKQVSEKLHKFLCYCNQHLLDTGVGVLDIQAGISSRLAVAVDTSWSSPGCNNTMWDTLVTVEALSSQYVNYMQYIDSSSLLKYWIISAGSKGLGRYKGFHDICIERLKILTSMENNLG